MYFVYIWYEVVQQCLLAFYDMDYMLSVKYAYCVFRTKGVVKSWLKHLWMVLECVHYTFDFRISFWSLHIQKPFTVARVLCGVGADSLTGCGLWNMEIYLQVNLGLVKIHRWQSSAWQWVRYHRIHDHGDWCWELCFKLSLAWQFYYYFYH